MSSHRTVCRHARIQKNLSEGVQIWWGCFLLLLFIVGEGIEGPNGQSSARQRNAIEMAFCWRADDVPKIECCLGSFVIFHGIRTSVAKNQRIPISLWFSGGGGGVRTPCSLLLNPTIAWRTLLIYYKIVIAACLAVKVSSDVHTFDISKKVHTNNHHKRPRLC